MPLGDRWDLVTRAAYLTALVGAELDVELTRATRRSRAEGPGPARTARRRGDGDRSGVGPARGRSHRRGAARLTPDSVGGCFPRAAPTRRGPEVSALSVSWDPSAAQAALWTQLVHTPPYSVWARRRLRTGDRAVAHGVPARQQRLGLLRALSLPDHGGAVVAAEHAGEILPRWPCRRCAAALVALRGGPGAGEARAGLAPRGLGPGRARPGRRRGRAQPAGRGRGRLAAARERVGARATPDRAGGAVPARARRHAPVRAGLAAI
ncbi:MAG: hypothetical protein MZW92_70910 [Comamonadaceae bacterium]|nr:hypothetical protein [Comamonadaceae bacterium]